MNRLALVLALGGSLLVAGAASAQTDTATAPPAGETGGQPASTYVAHVSAQEAQQLAQQPEIQQALGSLPKDAKDALTKAAQAQGGQLIGVSTESWSGTTQYVGEIERNGNVYKMTVGSDGKVTSWRPKSAH